MADFLDILGRDARKTVKEGYYEKAIKVRTPNRSLKEAVVKCRNAPIISEVKVASPTIGMIRKNVDLKRVAKAMEDGGAVGISFIIEPKHFKGSLDAFVEVRTHVKSPLLMKDIIVNQAQIDAAAKIGADAILLIETLFIRGYCECDVHGMIAYAHSKNLEVLLEAHTDEEFLSAQNTKADLVGINNRDLGTLQVDREATRRILTKNRIREKLVVSESGIRGPDDIRFLRKWGAQAFLVGSSIMRASDIKMKVKELVMAL